MNANILYILSKTLQKLRAKLKASSVVNLKADTRGAFTAYNIPPTSQSPALAEDLFSGRDPYGEYFFHVSANKTAFIQTNLKQSELASKEPTENPCSGGLRLHDSNFVFKHEVTVAFQKSSLDYAQSIIEDERKEEYDNFHAIREPLELDSKTIREFMALTPELSKVQLQIGNGDDWAAIAAFDKDVSEDVQVKFQFLKLTGGRVIEIVTRCTSLDQNIGDIYVPWLELLETYRDMPMNTFSGANSW